MIFWICLLFPCLLFASVPDIDVRQYVNEIRTFFDPLWNYKIFEMDKQSLKVSNIILAVIALTIGIKFSRYLSGLLKKKLLNFLMLDKSTANLVSRIIDYAILLLMVIIVLDFASVPLTIFTFIGGAFVVSIGLSTQHLVNNFISGIILIFENKIKVGDFIEINGIFGRIENVEARMVQIHTSDNVEFFVPHSKLMQESYAHWSLNSGKVKMVADLKINQKDWERAAEEFEKIIITAVSKSKKILIYPKPQILLVRFEDNFICFEVEYWINLNHFNRREIRSEVNFNIAKALKLNDIYLAVPERKFISI